MLLVHLGKMVLSVGLRRSLSGDKKTSVCIRTREVRVFEDKYALGMEVSTSPKHRALASECYDFRQDTTSHILDGSAVGRGDNCLVQFFLAKCLLALAIT